MKKFLVSVALWLLALEGLAAAQNSFPAFSQGGALVPGSVQMCTDVNNIAFPCNAASVGYPTGSTPLNAAGSGTTGAVSATLAGAAGVTTYICGFDVSGIGGTAALGPITVSGILGGPFTYQLASSASGVTLPRQWDPCLPASAANTAIVVTTTANGTATAVNVNVTGFRR